MNEFDGIKNKYTNDCVFNKTNNLIHSIDIEKYEADCKNFFDDSNNQQLLLELSNESNYIDLESEELFLTWLLKG